MSDALNIVRLQPDGLVVSPAFSHVAIVPSGATTIYVGGQNGVDATGKLVSSDIAEQSIRAIENEEIALAAAGATLADVVQWSVLLVADADRRGDGVASWRERPGR
jgi:enamine deaminase RidA (YjgF/YER057c/UK114 family)